MQQPDEKERFRHHNLQDWFRQHGHPVPAYHNSVGDGTSKKSCVGDGARLVCLCDVSRFLLRISVSISLSLFIPLILWLCWNMIYS